MQISRHVTLSRARSTLDSSTFPLFSPLFWPPPRAGRGRKYRPMGSSFILGIALDLCLSFSISVFLSFLSRGLGLPLLLYTRTAENSSRPARWVYTRGEAKSEAPSFAIGASFYARFAAADAKFSVKRPRDLPIPRIFSHLRCIYAFTKHATNINGQAILI